MESMLNKLKSTVTKVTADVTSAVMGNPVTREFDVGRHIASGGNGLAWKIFNGTKKSTKQVSFNREFSWKSNTHANDDHTVHVCTFILRNAESNRFFSRHFIHPRKS